MTIVQAHDQQLSCCGTTGSRHRESSCSKKHYGNYRILDLTTALLLGRLLLLLLL